MPGPIDHFESVWGDLEDVSRLYRHIIGGQGFKVVVPWCYPDNGQFIVLRLEEREVVNLPSTAHREAGRQFVDQMSLLPQSLLHALPEMLHHPFLQVRVFEEEIKNLVHRRLHALSVVEELLRVIGPARLLLFGEELFSPLWCKFLAEFGGDPGWGPVE